MATQTIGPYGTGILDSFNRANGDPGADWTTLYGRSRATLSASTLSSSIAYSGVYWNASSYGPNCEVWGYYPGGEGLNLIARAANPAAATYSFYCAYVRAYGWLMDKRINGTSPGALGYSTDALFVAGDWWALSCYEDTISLWRWASGGTSWTVVQSYIDTDISDAGYLGVRLDENSTAVDTFGGGTIGSAGISSSDVPNRYDVIISGNGYMLYDAADDSGSTRAGANKAVLSYSPTFLTRQNVSGAYGDDQQDLFLTWSQKDWSQGEGQKYFRTDAEHASEFWRGSNVDVWTKQGEVSLHPGVASTSTGGSVTSAWAPPLGKEATTYRDNILYATIGTSLAYSVTDLAVITSIGAHGLGTTPRTMTGDHEDLYMSATAAGTVGVRKYVPATTTYSTFSATAADVLHYHNNSLYGIVESTSTLYQYSTAGVASSVGTWKQIDGDPYWASTYQMCSYGGKLLILRTGGSPATQLWIFDGTALSMLQEFSPNFYGRNLKVLNGVVMVGGAYVYKMGAAAGATTYKPAVLYYTNQNIGTIWESKTIYTSSNAEYPYTLANLGLCIYDGRLMWWSRENAGMVTYDPATGGIVTTITLTGETAVDAYAANSFVFMCGGTNRYTHSMLAAKQSTGYVESSLFDFDSSLTKYFRGVTIDADIPVGATVDVYYQLNATESTWTLLSSSVSSGTEIDFTGITGKSIALKVVLNLGTATSSPVLKRLYLRAAPMLKQNRICQYVLNLGGIDGDSHVLLRDGTYHPKSGREQADNLILSVKATSPITVTDTFGTYTAMLIPENFKLNLDHWGEGTFIATVLAREV